MVIVRNTTNIEIYFILRIEIHDVDYFFQNRVELSKEGTGWIDSVSTDILFFTYIVHVLSICLE